MYKVSLLKYLSNIFRECLINKKREPISFPKRLGAAKMNVLKVSGFTLKISKSFAF